MRDEWLLFLWHHRGKLLGALFGLFAGWLIVHYGVIKFLVVLAFTVFGLWLGALADGDDPRGMWERVRRWWSG